MAYRYQVDESWTVKKLRAECKRRGMVGYSYLNKDGLISELNAWVGEPRPNLYAPCWNFVTQYAGQVASVFHST